MGTPNPFAPLSRTMEVKGLIKFEDKRLSKKRARLGVERLPEDNILGTPRSKRFIGIFPGCVGNSSILDALNKLHHLLEVALPLPKESGTTITVDYSSAANIRILIARIVEFEEI
ncbi:hypothetical protein CROQUDRAFT_99154 [Cronartium quercuum f. sp. fusiforme G11]|uniref:Uncharacterized protein n=1 Tax=Cronartium quercuum f. sp. fusiforme G11 TaxID=708437 RepID=A0A9P6NCD8_9BASI|nr:hypothetical protein CROQUDRAFT_99154 [Cronartium quercuum f. sp. fusiforme G11]